MSDRTFNNYAPVELGRIRDFEFLTFPEKAEGIAEIRKTLEGRYVLVGSLSKQAKAGKLLRSYSDGFVLRHEGVVDPANQTAAISYLLFDGSPHFLEVQLQAKVEPR